MALRFKDLPSIGESRMADEDAPAQPRLKPNIFAIVARAAIRQRLIIILAMLTFAVVSAGIGLSQFTADPAAPARFILAPGYTKAKVDLDQNFAGVEDEVTLAITAEDPSAGRSAAVALVRELRARPELFASVVAPGLGKIHEDNAILFASEAEARRVAEGLERRAPLFKALAAYPSLAGLAALAQQVEATLAAGGSPEGLEGLFAAAARTVAGEVAQKPAPLDWSELVELTPRPEQQDWNVRAIALREGGIETARRIAGDVAAVSTGVSVKVGGPVIARRAAAEKSAYGVRLAGILGFVLAAITLATMLGTARGAVAVLVALLALAGLAVALPVFDGLGVDGVSMFYLPAILFVGVELFSAQVLRSWELEEQGYGRRSAVALAQHRIGLASLLLATAGFAGLAWFASGYLSMRDLGFRLALGAVAALVLALTLAPALLSYGQTSEDRDETAKNWLDALLDSSGNRFWRQFRAAAAAAAIIVALAGLLLSWTLRLAPDHSEDTTAALLTPAAEAPALVEKLKALREVGRVGTIGDFLPAAQAANIATLARLANLYPPRAAEIGVRLPEELRADFDQLQASLQRIGNAPNVSPSLGEAANELRRTLALFDSPLPAEADQLRRLEVSLFGGLDALLARIARLARLEPLAPDALDSALKERYLAADGRWRIEIIGADGVAANRFAAAVQRAAALAVGPALAPYAAASPWPRPLALAGGFAALLIFLIAFRRVANVLAAAASFAITIFLFIGLLAVIGITPTMASLPVFLIFAILAAAIACRPTLRAETSRFGGGTARRGALLGGTTMLMASLPLLLAPAPGLADIGRVAVLAAVTLMAAAIVVQPQIAYWFGLETWRFRRPG